MVENSVESQLNGEQQYYFSYVVQSCTAMNDLRVNVFGEPQIVCEPNVNLLPALNEIGVFVDYRYTYFDPKYANDNKKNQL